MQAVMLNFGGGAGAVSRSSWSGHAYRALSGLQALVRSAVEKGETHKQPVSIISQCIWLVGGRLSQPARETAFEHRSNLETTALHFRCALVRD